MIQPELFDDTGGYAQIIPNSWDDRQSKRHGPQFGGSWRIDLSSRMSSLVQRSAQTQRRSEFGSLDRRCMVGAWSSQHQGFQWRDHQLPNWKITIDPCHGMWMDPKPNIYIYIDIDISVYIYIYIYIFIYTYTCM